MRPDVFIANDSGGFSVVAADAVDDIIGDARSDDRRFVASYKALLLELYGDDSMPVRFVIDEPLRPDEEAQWLARGSWRLDTSDGRLLAMGGFDPDVMSDWKEATGGTADGHGVAVFDAAPGRWRVDVYAPVGSMNGRAILDEGREKVGKAFRRSHGDRAFPLWLAKALEFSGEDAPGHEDLWTDVRASLAGARLKIPRLEWRRRRAGGVGRRCGRSIPSTPSRPSSARILPGRGRARPLMRAVQPVGQRMRGFFRRAPVERHQRRRHARKAHDVRAPAILGHEHGFDEVSPSCNGLLILMNSVGHGVERERSG